MLCSKHCSTWICCNKSILRTELKYLVGSVPRWHSLLQKFAALKLGTFPDPPILHLLYRVLLANAHAGGLEGSQQDTLPVYIGDTVYPQHFCILPDPECSFSRRVVKADTYSVRIIICHSFEGFLQFHAGEVTFFSRVHSIALNDLLWRQVKVIPRSYGDRLMRVIVVTSGTICLLFLNKYKTWPRFVDPTQSSWRCVSCTDRLFGVRSTSFVEGFRAVLLVPVFLTL